MQTTRRSTIFHAFISLVLSYGLVISSSALPLARHASAARAEKLSPDKSRLTPSVATFAQGQGQRSGELLVRFRAGVAQQSKDTALAGHGMRRKKQLRGESAVEKLEVLSGQTVETAALQLSLNPDVEFAEPNFLINKDDFGTSDPRFGEQWALRNTGQSGGQFGSDINASTAWQTTTGLESTTIPVIDSGIDLTHPDLTNNRWVNPAPGPNSDLNGWDYITDSGVIRDEQGHGTAIAGIIAAQGNNAIGISGVMWRASLMSLRVLDNTGSGDVGSAVEAIDYAVQHGAAVVDLSWGTSGYSLALKDAIERAMRRGVVVVCSAGNNGQDVDAVPYYPASYGLRDLIAVGSIDNFDQLTSWSDYGQRNVTVDSAALEFCRTRGHGSQPIAILQLAGVDQGWPGHKVQPDLDSPAPGFRLGLPTLQQRFYNPQSRTFGYLMVTPSGQRIEMREVGIGVFESADGGYIRSLRRIAPITVFSIGANYH